jgi:hypothetical protein
VLVLAHWRHWPGDLAAVYFAAGFWAEGRFSEIYAAPALFFGTDYAPSWTAAVTASGHADEIVYPYVYPPIWAALFAPVAAALTPDRFFQLAYAVQIPLIAASILLAWRIMGRPFGFTRWVLVSLVLFMLSMPMTQSLTLNQPQILVGFLTLLAMDRLGAGRAVLAGAILGLAAAIKLSPILLLVLFLPDRDWRRLAAALGTAALIAALSLIVAGWPLHRAFLDRLATISGEVVVTEINYALKTMFYMLTDPGGDGLVAATKRVLVAPLPAWINPLLVALFVVGSTLLLARLRGLAPAERLRRGLAPMLILATLTAPLSWAHHYLTALLLVPGLVALWPRAVAWPAILAIALAQNALVLRWLNPADVTDGLPMYVGTLTYALAALAFALAPRQDAR